MIAQYLTAIRGGLYAALAAVVGMFILWSVWQYHAAEAEKKRSAVLQYQAQQEYAQIKFQQRMLEQANRVTQKIMNDKEKLLSLKERTNEQLQKAYMDKGVSSVATERCDSVGRFGADWSSDTIPDTIVGGLRDFVASANGASTSPGSSSPAVPAGSSGPDNQ